MRQQLLWAAMATAGLLAGCGGGGGGDETPAVQAATVSLSGTAAKGLMAKADVKVHPVKSDGTVDLATVLASTVTDDNGGYNLSFPGTKDQPYVVRVTANSQTTHRNELTGQSEALPVGFSMRSVIVPAQGGTVSTSAAITPFSEMAVAAALNTSGGLTKTNTEQAVSTVTQILGFDPVKVDVKPAASASTVEQQAAAVMLAAVAQLASDGALGCSTGDAAAKTQCVVGKLAEAAKSTTKELVVGGTDVSTALKTAVDTVFENPTAVAEIPRTVVEVAVNNLDCKTTNTCTVATVTPATEAIAAAKAMFAQIKTDITSVLFGSGSSVVGGPLQTEAAAFESALDQVQFPAKTAVNDLGTLLMGLDLYYDYKNGRTTDPNRFRAEGEVKGTLSLLPASACTLYQTNPSQPGAAVATSASNANFIGCSAHYLGLSINGTQYRFRHGFSVTPPASGLEFAYASRARRTCVGTCSGDANLALQTNGSTGTITPVLDGNQRVVGFSVRGQIPGMFKRGSYNANTNLLAFASEYNDWSMDGTRTISGFKQEISQVTGSVTLRDASAAQLGKLTINGGKSTEIPVTADGTKPTVSSPATQGTIAGLELDLLWETPAVKVTGVLKAADAVWDKSGTGFVPTTLELSGTLANVTNGTARTFAKGRFTATIGGYANFDETQPVSATNTFTMSPSFVGSITAPNRPELEVTVSGTMPAHLDTATAFSMQYRTLVAGTPRSVVTVTRTVGTGGEVFTLSEASANLALSWTSGAATASLKRGDLAIGSLNLSNSVVTFTDNSFASLDLGL